ncbi:hypothetical protein J6590_075603 [Homalodisca vitripennis]|nr:hypothetical protein J6590_075603 [Homalodisca vitripennis]
MVLHISCYYSTICSAVSLARPAQSVGCRLCARLQRAARRVWSCRLLLIAPPPLRTDLGFYCFSSHSPTPLPLPSLPFPCPCPLCYCSLNTMPSEESLRLQFAVLVIYPPHRPIRRTPHL